ncbi:hypothetical protein F5Y03DRAFT_395086 [Xylaria venustula]|nr:hypothetical protein F5Y03DRAFT_395086 [Xylaria venustula]
METPSSEKYCYVVDVDITSWIIIAGILLSIFALTGIIVLIVLIINRCCYLRRQRMLRKLRQQRQRRQRRQSQVDIELGEPNEQNSSRQSLESVYSAPNGSVRNNAQPEPELAPQPATRNGQNISQEFEEISLSNSSSDVIHTAHAIPLTQIYRARAMTDVQSTPSSPGDQVQSPKFYIQTVSVPKSKKVTPPSTSEN